jgi:hypothetical protein
MLPQGQHVNRKRSGAKPDQLYPEATSPALNDGHVYSGFALEKIDCVARASPGRELPRRFFWCAAASERRASMEA